MDDLIGKRVKALRPDFDHDEEDNRRDIPVGSLGTISRLNQGDSYDIFWDNGAWTIYDRAEIGTDLEVIS